MNEFEFFKKYEKMKKEIRNTKELANPLTNGDTTLKYLREIEIINEAFSKSNIVYLNGN